MRTHGDRGGDLVSLTGATLDEPVQATGLHVTDEASRRVSGRDHLLDLAEGAGGAAAHQAARARVAAAVPRADRPLSVRNLVLGGGGGDRNRHFSK
jgi:hypothetical protein